MTRLTTRGLFALALVCAFVAQASMSNHASLLTDIPYPSGRPPSPAEIELGRMLFFDTAVTIPPG